MRCLLCGATLVALAISTNAATLRGRFDLTTQDSAVNVITALAIDSQGFIYETGATTSANFPVTPGPLSKFLGTADVFVRKLSPDGATVIYSVLVGGSAAAQGTAIAVDGQGNAYVTGSTTSPNFPVTPPFLPSHLPGQGSADAFVFKLNAGGTSLLFSQMFGPNSSGASVAIATDGSIIVAGSVASTGLPVTSTALGTAPAHFDQNAFVIRLANDGSLNYCTYLGGTGGATATGVAVDPGGDIYVAGYAGAFFPTTLGGLAPQALSGGFVSRISGQTGQFVYSTYVPGVFGYNEYSGPGIGPVPAVQIQVDSKSDVYLSGVADAGFQTTPGAFQREPYGEADGFVMELDSSGARVIFATFTGGSVSGLALTGDSITVAESAGLDSLVTDYSLPSCNLSSGESEMSLASFDHSGRLLTSAVYGECQHELPTALASGAGGVVLSAAYPAANSACRTFLALIDMTASLPVQIAAVVNAASYGVESSAPLELVTVFGAGLGPKQGIAAPLPGTLPVSLAGTEVRFNGLPVPLLYVQEGQITAIFPSTLLPGSLNAVTVTNNSGGASNSSQPLYSFATQYAPALFTADGSGIGQAGALNGDGSPNSSSNPVVRGGVVSLFGTGGGVTSLASGDGQVASNPNPLPWPPLVVIGDVFGDVSYAGSAPGLVNGVLQINVSVPQNAPTGNAVPVTVLLGNFSDGFSLSQAAVTIAVR